MIELGSDKKTSDYSSVHQVLARVAIFIYVVLAPGSMWATWQAASTGKCTPSPPSNAQASIFSYFSHTHPPRACSTYLSLLVLIVHWLWVWAQVERVLLGHLMLVRAFFVLLSCSPTSCSFVVFISTGAHSPLIMSWALVEREYYSATSRLFEHFSYFILTSWKCWRFWEVKMFSLWAEFAQSRETSSGPTSDNSRVQITA